MNSYNQGSGAGGYTVQSSGESLRSVALQLWGDASLWYKLASANGLDANAALIEGQRLTIPAGVARSTFNADTLRPYDPNDAIGNVSPTTPKPKKANKCGVFGQILLAAVAIAVTVAAPFGGGLVGQIGNAVAGSVVSQGLGVATGIQSKFSFKSVAMAAIGAGVGGVLGDLSPLGTKAGAFANDVARGALGSALTQGIGVATGLQSKFSWAGVAAAGIGSGVGNGVARELADDNGLFGIKAASGSFGNDFASISASLIANAATRSAVSGSNFGDNILRGLPDAIGGTLGRSLGRYANERLFAAEKLPNPSAEVRTSGGGSAALNTGGSVIKGVRVGYSSSYSNFLSQNGGDGSVNFGEGFGDLVKQYAPGLYNFGQVIGPHRVVRVDC